MKKGGSLLLTDKCDRLLSNTNPIWANGMFSNKCVEYYFHNISEIRGLSDSSLYGVIFTIKVPNTSETVYINDQVENTGEPVRTLLLKITYVNNSANTDTIQNIPIAYARARQNKASASEDEFKIETMNQQRIYAQSGHLGEPLCPSVLHAECLTFPNSNRLLARLNILHRVTNPQGRQYLNYIHYILNHNPNLRLGITVMDFMEGYEQLHDVITNGRIPIDNRRMIASCAIYQNIRLMTLGYIHSDLHTANIMVNMNNQNFLDGHAFKCVIIDFGRTVYNADLIKDLLNVNMRLTRNFLHRILEMLYNRYRNPAFPENYIVNLLIRNYRIFRNYDDMIQSMTDVIRTRVSKIDSLIQDDKYSDGTHPLCARSYIDDRGSPIIHGVRLNNRIYIQGRRASMNIHIDPYKQIDYRRGGRVVRVDVLDFDIVLYYISQNIALLNSPLLNVILDYMHHQRSGKFIKNCSIPLLYLNAIRKSRRYNVRGRINPELEQFRLREEARLIRRGIILRPAAAAPVRVSPAAPAVAAAPVRVSPAAAPAVVPIRVSPAAPAVAPVRISPAAAPVAPVRVSPAAAPAPIRQMSVESPASLQGHSLDDIYTNITYLFAYLQQIGQTGQLITDIQSFITSYNNPALPDRERELYRMYQTVKPTIDMFIDTILAERRRAFGILSQALQDQSNLVCNPPNHNQQSCDIITYLVSHTNTSTIPLLNTTEEQIIDGTYTSIGQLNTILAQYQIAVNEVIRLTSQQQPQPPTSGGKRKTIKRKMRSKRAKTRKN